MALITTNVQHIQGTNNQAAEALSEISIATITGNNPIGYHLIHRELHQDASLPRLTEENNLLQFELVQL